MIRAMIEKNVRKMLKKCVLLYGWEALALVTPVDHHKWADCPPLFGAKII
jgi:hypothetical protein